MRYAWIEQHRDEYAVSRMCRLLAVSRTGFLQWRRRPPSARAHANARLDVQVAAQVLTTDGNAFNRIRQDLLLKIMGVVERSGTSFAFPTQTVRLEPPPAAGATAAAAPSGGPAPAPPKS